MSKSHDTSRSCPSGGEGRYSSHEICFGGRAYSDMGRRDGCYDRTDKPCGNYSGGPSYSRDSLFSSKDQGNDKDYGNYSGSQSFSGDGSYSSYTYTPQQAHISNIVNTIKYSGGTLVGGVVDGEKVITVM